MIAIIALLAAILFPALKQARFKATLAVCTNNIRQSYLGLQMYGNDSNGWYPLADEGGVWPPQPAGYSVGAFGDAGVPGLVQTLGYITNPRVVHCPGKGGLTKYGWPTGGFGPNDTYLGYVFCNLRRVDLWVGNPWRQEYTFSNSFWGGLILRCLSVNAQNDPRSWTHQNVTLEMRNDSGLRARYMAVTGLANCGAWCVTVNYDPGFVLRDDFFMGR